MGATLKGIALYHCYPEKNYTIRGETTEMYSICVGDPGRLEDTATDSQLFHSKTKNQRGGWSSAGWAVRLYSQWAI
jgi:hypothetical protein